MHMVTLARASNPLSDRPCRPTRPWRNRTWRTTIAVAALLSLTLPSRGNAQTPPPREVAHELFVGSESEQYLRLLQTLGKAELFPWGVRGFGVVEAARMAPDEEGHPWAGRYRYQVAGRGPEVRLIAPEGAVIMNSAVPYGYNDGSVWAGRGLTLVGRVGVAARYGPISITLAPEFFQAQNSDFDLHPSPQPGGASFADPAYPTSIDLPQRFGTGSYGRLTPGQSTLRVDLLGVTAGISSANQHWGPVWDQPLLLGNNAEGFPHAFLGSSRPVNLWVGHLHGRVVWGALAHSDHAPLQITSSRRLMTGLVATFQPRGLPELEIGGGRFFHQEWPAGGPGWDELLWPFQSLLKEGLSNDDDPDGNDPDNQIASVFARLVVPAAGAELYGEYAREDHNWNLRDLALEPDHNSAYVIGMAKGWDRGGEEAVWLRGEVMNARVSALRRIRGQTPLYRHSRMRQGHTHLGQILGAASGYGGAHARLQADLYHPGGRWSAALVRSRHLMPPVSGPESITSDENVSYALELGGRWFLGRVEVDALLAPVYEFNRYLEDDVVNLHGRVQASWRW